jgi:hypothetical protein
MLLFMTSEELREWAERCGLQAEAAGNEFEKFRLSRMYTALIELAETQDWLDGRKTIPLIQEQPERLTLQN